MSAALVFVFLLFALVIPLLLWLAIENETSAPTVVDRSEAERLAKERSGRNASRAYSTGDSARDAGRRDRDDRSEADDRPSEPEPGWGHRDDEWGDRGRDRDWDRDRR